MSKCMPGSLYPYAFDARMPSAEARGGSERSSCSAQGAGPAHLDELHVSSAVGFVQGLPGRHGRPPAVHLQRPHCTARRGRPSPAALPLIPPPETNDKHINRGNGGSVRAARPAEWRRGRDHVAAFLRKQARPVASRMSAVRKMAAGVSAVYTTRTRRAPVWRRLGMHPGGEGGGGGEEVTVPAVALRRRVAAAL